MGLLKGLLCRVPWGQAMEGRGAQESWLMSQHHILSGQPGGCRGDQELLAKARHGQEEAEAGARAGSWEEERDVALAARDGVWKAKAQLEVSLVWDVQDNKKGCPASPSSLGSYSKVLKDFLGTQRLFALVFTSKSSSQAAQGTEGKGRDWENL